MSIAIQNPATHSSFATAIPRAYVHKAAESEVLLTGWNPVGPDRHRITARWPIAHPFYGPVGGFHDPLLVAESVRQCVPLLSHVAYDAPFGHRQTWSSFRYELDPAALAVTGADAEVELRVTCSDVVRRGGRLASLNMHVEMFVDGRPLGTVETGFANLSPALYTRLRGAYADLDRAVRRTVPLAPPMPAARVARARLTDVVLSPTSSPARNQLRVDLNHPTLFDHAVDHAPGMLLLEAARQAVHAQTYPQPVIATAMEVVFTQYVELDAPCWIHTEPLADAGEPLGPVRVSAVQNGVCAFSAVVTPTAVTSSVGVRD
ncbi:ScbA/BarX family gamma-butyrolactone biosynthesis protein [Streptomyces sp. NPDC029004]|uniref:ScbA/BarX family gamma-butyrolactone biosynthesis protein n=1 Tax=Streptomyces sp. NPDC029004 TaxID=3154490 RepID=UPI0033C4BABD